jgi:hypothetical protein
VSCRFCCQLAATAAKMIPPEQPNTPHTQPVVPAPNVLPAITTTGPANDVAGDKASEAATTPVMRSFFISLPQGIRPKPLAVSVGFGLSASTPGQIKIYFWSKPLQKRYSLRSGNRWSIPSLITMDWPATRSTKYSRSVVTDLTSRSGNANWDLSRLSHCLGSGLSNCLGDGLVLGAVEDFVAFGACFGGETKPS